MRPWGYFEVLGEGEGHKVKHLALYPGGRTSLQSHKHRREVWVVVTGSAYVTVNGAEFSALPGQVVMVGYGEVHRIENRSTGPLLLVEVQTGSSCAEDDIERFEDDYGRVMSTRARACPGEGIRSHQACRIYE